MDFYGFYTGKEFEAYRFLGAHACEKGTVFRTFAPNAQRISLIGGKFAFGFGQSRWGYKTPEDFVTVAEKYRENHIPIGPSHRRNPLRPPLLY